MIGIGPKFPLALDSVDGAYLLIKELKEEVKQNFKNLLLTIPGERVMDPEFGIGIERFLFENNTIELRSAIDTRIKQQVRKYLPFIQVRNLIVSPEEDPMRMDPNSLFVEIKYFIAPIATEDILNITLPYSTVSEEGSSQSSFQY
tara:strand:+ start:309 stop:743 length:435 start_codon:yes stop_codon:yes gene_type:complete